MLMRWHLLGYNYEKVGASTVRLRAISSDEFTKALHALTEAKRKLEQAKEPAKARAVVDEMERILADARRALWKLEQQKKKSPAKK